jgi:large subunit ribosomal protein L22
MAKRKSKNSNIKVIEKVQISYLRMAPRKVRLVADLIKRLPAVEAEAQLMYERRRAAKPLLKLLRSAMSNIKSHKRLDPNKLFVENLVVDGGPMLKRHLPRARGVASPIQRKMSHVTLTLSERDNVGVPKFKIVIEKKVKLPQDDKSKNDKKKTQKETMETVARRKEPGFFKRFFRRKSV